jgi:hypothetical protein
MASEMNPALRGTRKEEKIHNARAARAEVEVLLKTTEKSMETPSQKEM